MNTKYIFWKTLFIGGGAALLYWRIPLWLGSNHGLVRYLLAGVILLLLVVARIVLTHTRYKKYAIVKIPTDQFCAYVLISVIGTVFGLFIGAASLFIIHGILMHPPDAVEGDIQKKQPKAKIFQCWDIE